MITVPVPVNFSRMKPSPPLMPVRPPWKAMPKSTVDSAATKASFSANQARFPVSSRARISPGSTPAKPTVPSPPVEVKYWKASDSPASARWPTCMAVPIAWRSMPPMPPPWPAWPLRPRSGPDRRVSMLTLAVLNRNLPASQYTVWPGVRFTTAICMALPTISC